MLDLIVIALLQTVAGDPLSSSPPAPAASEAPASAGDPQTSAPDSTAAAPDAEPQYREERVCERMEVSTGERMPRRRCRTVRVLIDPDEQPAEQPDPQ